MTTPTHPRDGVFAEFYPCPFCNGLHVTRTFAPPDARPTACWKKPGAMGDGCARNMLIQGDNLHALKALLPYYAGKVKCIYIDPPYNTRSAFEHYDDNLEHTRWLSMMYPRLELLRDFLSEDGSIWVSCDDNEGHYLKVIWMRCSGEKILLPL